MQKLISEDELSLIDYWKQYNLKNVVDNAADAWSEVSEETLKRAWNKLWPESTDFVDKSDDLTTEDVISIALPTFQLEQNDINEWLECDNNDPGFQLLSDDEIIDGVNQVEEDDSVETEAEYDGGDDESVAAAPIDLRLKAKEAACNMQKFIEWYQQQDESNSTDVMLLRRMRTLAAKKSETTVKQAKLTNYFLKE